VCDFTRSLILNTRKKVLFSSNEIFVEAVETFQFEEGFQLLFAWNIRCYDSSSSFISTTKKDDGAAVLISNYKISRKTDLDKYRDKILSLLSIQLFYAQLKLLSIPISSICPIHAVNFCV